MALAANRPRYDQDECGLATCERTPETLSNHSGQIGHLISETKMALENCLAAIRGCQPNPCDPSLKEGCQPPLIVLMQRQINDASEMTKMAQEILGLIGH